MVYIISGPAMLLEVRNRDTLDIRQPEFYTPMLPCATPFDLVGI